MFFEPFQEVVGVGVDTTAVLESVYGDGDKLDARFASRHVTNHKLPRVLLAHCEEVWNSSWILALLEDERFFKFLPCTVCLFIVLMTTQFASVCSHRCYVACQDFV